MKRYIVRNTECTANTPPRVIFEESKPKVLIGTKCQKMGIVGDTFDVSRHILKTYKDVKDV